MLKNNWGQRNLEKLESLINVLFGTIRMFVDQSDQISEMGKGKTGKKQAIS